MRDSGMKPRWLPGGSLQGQQCPSPWSLLGAGQPSCALPASCWQHREPGVPGSAPAAGTRPRLPGWPGEIPLLPGAAVSAGSRTSPPPARAGCGAEPSAQPRWPCCSDSTNWPPSAACWPGLALPGTAGLPWVALSGLPGHLGCPEPQPGRAGSGRPRCSHSCPQELPVLPVSPTWDGLLPFPQQGDAAWHGTREFQTGSGQEGS